jgi:hypothetical protein
MNNIIPFRGRSAASKFSIMQTQPAKAGPQRPGRVHVLRPALFAVWHTNPFNGKQECVWTTEARAIRDEDGSRGTHGHRAA